MRVMVRDLVADIGNTERTHMLGSPPRPVLFRPHQATEMDFEAAKPLLAIPEGFVVQTEDGKTLKPREEMTFAGAAVSLRSDQTIASFDELTKEALLARAKKIDPGMDASRPKDKLIDFLLNSSPEVIPGGSVEIDEDEDPETGPIKGL